MSKNNESAKTGAANMSEGTEKNYLRFVKRNYLGKETIEPEYYSADELSEEGLKSSINVVKIDGKAFENRTKNLQNWYNFTNEQKNTIEKKYGKPIYLVRQIFDSKGQKMTEGQKTLCIFEHGAIVDKTTLKKLCGIEISERPTNGKKTEKTDLQKLYSLISKIVENDLVKADKETENNLVNIVERLADKVDNEKRESEKRAKDEALKNDLLSRGFSEAEIAAILAGPKK